MTTRVLIAHEAARDDFEANGAPEHGNENGCAQYTVSKSAPLDIRRRRDSVRAYILNLGPCTLNVLYFLESQGGPPGVGPISDYILPGQFKEIGAAKGVVWRLKEV